MNKCTAYFFLCLMLLAGCRVGPRYVPPCTEVPDQWKQPSADDNVVAASLDYWWEVFDDSRLNELEFLAVANNPSLYTALQKVVEARAMAGVEAANLYPQINLNGSFQDSAMLYQPLIPPNLLNALSGPLGPAVSSALSPFRFHLFQYMLPLNLNYEVDLWGKLRDQYDSALFNAQAEQDAYYGALLTLTADLATSYFQLRSQDAQIVYLRGNLQTRYKNLQITQSRYDKGLVNYLDVTQAQVDLATVKANLDEAIRLRRLAENQIAVLVGDIPSLFRLEPLPLENPPPIIPAGVPSTILLRRPDIAQAERTMASQHALIGAAYASFFPAFSLTAALGYSSPDIAQFLRWISRYWMLGANMSQMVFDGGRDCAYLEAAFARFAEASGDYQQQVLTAFREVEDALTNLAQYEQQYQHVFEAVEASRRATKLSMNRYVQGVAIYLEVVENERLELQQEVTWINILNLRYAATVQLIKALGGGW